MKNLNLLINIVLVIAVTVLFALHFSNNKKSKPGNSTDNSTGSVSNMAIAYVNADSLTANYQMYKDELAAASERSASAEEKFSAEQRKFEKDANEFQQRAQFLTITDREAKQEKLVRRQQELMQLEQQLAGDLQRQEAEVTKRIFDTIDVFIKSYAVEKELNYILSYARGGGVWFADPRFDITPEVLKELNARYKK
jgi:outer membrane protein